MERTIALKICHHTFAEETKKANDKDRERDCKQASKKKTKQQHTCTSFYAPINISKLFTVTALDPHKNKTYKWEI